MLTELLTYLRTIAGILGTLLVVVGVCADRAANGRVQSVVLTLWTNAADFGDRAVRRHTRFVVRTARITLTFLDWLFGRDLIRVRCLWTTACLSMASMGLAVALLAVVAEWVVHFSTTGAVDALRAKLREGDPSLHQVWPPLSRLIVGCVGFSAVPAVFRRPILQWANLRTLGLAVASLYLTTSNGLFMSLRDILATPIRTLLLTQIVDLELIAPFMLLGIISDMLVLAVARWALRRCASVLDWQSGLAALFSMFVVLLLISGSFLTTAFRLLPRESGLVVITVWVASVPMNLFDISGVVIIGTGLAVLFAHKLFWPVALGIIERVYELVPNRKAVIASGVTLILGANWTSIARAFKVFTSLLPVS